MNTVSLRLKVLETDESLANVMFLTEKCYMSEWTGNSVCKIKNRCDSFETKQITYVSRSFVQQIVLLYSGTIHI